MGKDVELGFRGGVQQFDVPTGLQVRAKLTEQVRFGWRCEVEKVRSCWNYALGIQSYSQIMIRVSDHLLSIVFWCHYHSQKVIGSLRMEKVLFFLETPLRGTNMGNFYVNPIVNGIYIYIIFIYECIYTLGFVRPGKNLELVSQSIYTYITI